MSVVFSCLQLLEAQCLATEQCVAFTSGGEFKNSVQPPGLWLDSTEDLYVAGVGPTGR